MNELTYENYIKRNQEDIFHTKFDNAIESLTKEFNNEDYPVIINNEKIYTRDKYKHISPVDRRIILGYVSKISDRLLNEAIDSSFQSFKEWSKLDYRKRSEFLKT